MRLIRALYVISMSDNKWYVLSLSYSRQLTYLNLHKNYSHQPSCWTLTSGEECRSRRRRSEEPQFKETQFKLISCMRQTQVHATNSKTITQNHNYNHIVIIIIINSAVIVEAIDLIFTQNKFSNLINPGILKTHVF